MLITLSSIASDSLKLDFWKPPRKKLIECGWSNPDTEFLRENIKMIEENTPYNGIRIRVTGQADGKAVNHRMIFSKTPWKYEWFNDAVEDLKRTEFKKFTDNFLATGVQPGDVDWFSDADWAAVCNNFSIMARIAKETKMSGLMFDPESYSKKIWRFDNFKGHSYADTSSKARQRGQEFANAIFAEFPNMKLFCFLWLSLDREYSESPDSASLFVPFINGVYDRLPPEAIIIDGQENFGYRAKGQAEYYRMRMDFYEKLPKLVDKSNISKFRRQTQLAAATYLDPYFGGIKGNTWYDALCPEIEQIGNVEFFRRNLTLALEISDEYAWTWGEKMSWGPTAAKKIRPRWEEKVPGITNAVLAASDPLKYAENFLIEKKPANLLKNSDFSQEKDAKGNIPNWSFWQQEKLSHGTCTLVENQGKNGSNAILLQGVFEGALSQSISVKPGQQYLIRVRGKITADNNSPGAHLRATVRWGNDKAKWNNCRQDKSMTLGTPDHEGWMNAELLVTVPDDSYKLFLLLKGHNQNAENKAYFDNAEIYAISP